VSHFDELTFASNDGVDGPRHGLLRNGVDLRPFHLAASDSGFSARAAAIRSRKCMNGMGFTVPTSRRTKDMILPDGNAEP